MGRGRAKAKQTKVARELKYHHTDTDFAALAAELGGTGLADEAFDEEVDELEDDPYAKYYDPEVDEDEEEESAEGDKSA